jgi:hypothetical protein
MCAKISVSAAPPPASLIANVHAASCESVAELCVSEFAAAAAQISPAFPSGSVGAEAAKLEPTVSNDPAIIIAPNFTDMHASQYSQLARILSFFYAEAKSAAKKENMHKV